MWGSSLFIVAQLFSPFSWPELYCGPLNHACPIYHSNQERVDCVWVESATALAGSYNFFHLCHGTLSVIEVRRSKRFIQIPYMPSPLILLLLDSDLNDLGHCWREDCRSVWVTWQAGAAVTEHLFSLPIGMSSAPGVHGYFGNKY